MKKFMIMLFAAAIPFTMAGCGDSDASVDADASIDEDADDGLDAEYDTDGDTSSVNISFDEDYGEVTLCNYKGLSAEKNIYEITEEDIESEIDNLLYDYVEYEDVDRPSKDGDYVSVLMTGSDNGTVIYDYSDEPYDISLGYEEFGEEFDSRLTGVSVGDELSFTIKYDTDYEDDELAGMTIDYDITVTEIYEEILPELTDEFITDTLGYDSREDMTAQITAELEASNEETSTSELRENLIQQVIDNSTFGSYSQDLYDSCKASIDDSYLSYAWMFGCETAQEVYTLFGMSDEDVNKEVLNLVHRLIVIQTIGKEENINVSDEDYNEGVARYAEEMEYDSAEELLEEYDEDSIYSWLIEDKVLDILEENATIKTVTASLDEEE